MTDDAEVDAIVAELGAATSSRMTAQDGPYRVQSRRWPPCSARRAAVPQNDAIAEAALGTLLDAAKD